MDKKRLDWKKICVKQNFGQTFIWIKKNWVEKNLGSIIIWSEIIFLFNKIWVGNYLFIKKIIPLPEY